MKAAGLRIAPLVLLLAASSGAVAQQRFPPPEFETAYRQPPTATPPTSPGWTEYADLAVLAAALGLAAVLALRFRRRWALTALGVAALLYLGFYRGGCICPIGAIQNVTLAIFDSTYAIPLAVLGFFLLPLVAAVLFGRVFCAAVCPLGMAQDLVALKPLRVPSWLEHALGLLAWVYLGLAVLFVATGAAMIICRYDPFVSIFRLFPVGKVLEGWARRDPALNPVALSGRIDTLLLAGAFLAIGVFIARPYCRYFCPYGVLLGLLSRVSHWRATITPAECVQCRLCEDSCPVGAIRTPTPQAPSRQRLRGKTALAVALAGLPLLVIVGGLAGGLLGRTMARIHPTVALSDRIRAENAGEVTGTTDASDAFRATGREPADLHAEAAGIEARFVGLWRPLGLPIGGAHLLGAFIGLVIGLKLVNLGLRRTRTDYEPERASCIACGRCFAHCPVETARRKGTKLIVTSKAT